MIPTGHSTSAAVPPIPDPVPKVPSPQAQISQELPAIVPKQQSSCTYKLPVVGCHAQAKLLLSANPTSLTQAAAFVPNCFKLPFPQTHLICSSEATAVKLGSLAEPFPNSNPRVASNRAKRQDQTTLGSLNLTKSSWAPSHVPQTTSGISNSPTPSPDLPRGTVSLPGR